ncbi:hypothetical protein [Sphingomonas sp. CROZ-RG-20F-R02-07]|uniref:hypothetical protein n=1 Tax=Sphingomonas sp. CROZ-RG-20F-R02-07 TaxID=2914832 RepID=UPI001F59EED8|nr:hypothetical protein [Sphingomonas sp. CROZ-RG-20F-R02-07]
MIRCVRLWTGKDGNSDFEEGRIEFGKGGGADHWTPDQPATNVSFRETPSGGDFDWHQDPVPRIVLTLSGTLEFEVKSGRTFTIRPGDVLLAQDNSGTGHKWRLLDEQPWRRAYVVIPDAGAVPFTANNQGANA